MDQSVELVFRVAIGVLWLVYFGVRMFFQGRVKHTLTYTHVNKRKELLLFRLFALANFLIALYFLTPWIDFAALPLPPWLRWAGAGVTVAGIGLFSWAHWSLGQHWTAILALSNEHELVESGPYRYMRHPMYSAFFIIGIGFMLLAANWLVGLTYLLPLTVMVALRLGAEEQMMVERFGERYLAYMRRTGSLLPRL